MVENYRTKLIDVIALWNSVAAGDSNAETEAANDLSEAANKGRHMAFDLIDRLRPYMSPEQLDRAAGVTDGS